MRGFLLLLLLNLVDYSYQIGLGDLCTDESHDLECTSSIINAKCDNDWNPEFRICDCPYNYIQTGESSCHEISTSSCENHPSECATSRYLECDEETKKCGCIYPNIQVNLWDGIACFPEAGLGEHCFYSQQCEGAGNSSCRSNLCVCQGNFVPSSLSNKCLKTASLIGDDCEEDIQCSELGNAFCNLGKCSCREGTVANRDSDFCGVPGGIGESCKNIHICEDASGNTSPIECLQIIDGNHVMCTCSRSYNSNKEVEGSCYGSVGVGGNCTSSEHCQAFISGPVFCHPEDNTCNCDENYVEYKENNYAPSKCIPDI